MIHILRKNNKKILAILGVFLMVAFILPSQSRNQLARGPHDQIGTAQGEVVTESQLTRAENDLYILRHHLSPALGMDLVTAEIYDRLEQPIYKYFRANGMRSAQAYDRQAYAVASRAASQLDRTAFALLLLEARNMGVQPNPEAVRLVMDTTFANADAQTRQVAEGAVKDWQSILASFGRVSEAVKVTPAWSQRTAAVTSQQASLSLVEFTAEQFVSQVPEPATEQLKSFFKERQDQDPLKNDQGIGYRYPDRLKLEWVMVPYDQIRKTVTGEDAAEYYNKHASQFMATTMPATAPATQASTQPSTKPVEPIQVQRKWELGNDVDREIRDRIAEERAAQVWKSIQAMFVRDWTDYRVNAKEAGSRPTPLGPAYTSDAYAVRLAHHVQEQDPQAHGVLPTVVRDGEVRALKYWQENPPFNDMTVRDPSSPLFGARVADYIYSTYQPFLPAEAAHQLQEEHVPLLDLYKPTTEPLQDKQKNYYIVRVIAADPAHPAPGYEDVAAQVKKDYINLQAYQKAKDAASKFVELARKQGFDAALKADAARKVITTDLFTTGPGSSPKFKEGKLPDAQFPSLIKGAEKLLADRVRTGEEHPLNVIDFPKALAVAAARLDSARPAVEDQPFRNQTGSYREGLREQLCAQLLVQWLTPADVIKRMSYVPVVEKKQGNAPQQQAPIGPAPIGS